MAARSTRIVMPEASKAGDVVRVRCLIQHPMITGHSAAGANTAPRNIIHTLIVTYAGDEIFRADLQPGIAANPYMAFSFRAVATGDVVFTWSGDGGEETVVRRLLTVTP